MLRDKNDGKCILLKIALMRAWETVLMWLLLQIQAKMFLPIKTEFFLTYKTFANKGLLSPVVGSFCAF